MGIVAFLKGIRSFAGAHHVIVRHRLWTYLIVPGVVSIVFISALIFAGGYYFDDISVFIIANWLPAALQGSFATFLTNLFLWMLLTVVIFMAYKHLVLIVLAPILAHLSEKTEEVVNNDQPPAFSFALFINDLGRGLVINVRNIFMTLLFTALVWPLVFIPVIGAIVSGLLMAMIQAYYGGFGLVDCVLERKRYSVRNSIVFARQNRWRLLGLGTGFLLVMAIPIVGWFIAPAYGVVAATLTALDTIDADNA